MSVAVIASTTVSELRLMFCEFARLPRMPVTTIAPASLCPLVSVAAVVVLASCARAGAAADITQSATTDAPDRSSRATSPRRADSLPIRFIQVPPHFDNADSVDIF